MKYRLKINILTCSLPLFPFPFQKPAAAGPRPKKVKAGMMQRKGAASSTGGGGGAGGGSSGTAIVDLMDDDESQEADGPSSASPSSSPSSLQANRTRGPDNERMLNWVVECLAVQLEKA